MTARASYVDYPRPIIGSPGSGALVSGKRISHRYTQSAPSALLPIPSLSSSLTSISSAIANSSTLTTPTCDTYDEYIAPSVTLNIVSITGSGTTTPEVDQEFDVPTPKASPRASSRIPVPVLLVNRTRRYTAPTESEVATVDRGPSYSDLGFTQRSQNLRKSNPSFIPISSNSVRSALGSKKLASKSTLRSPSATVLSHRRRTFSPATSRPNPSQPSQPKPTLAISFVSSPDPCPSQSLPAMVSSKTDVDRLYSHRRYSSSEIGKAMDSAARKCYGAASCSTSLCSPQTGSYRTSSSSSSLVPGSQAETMSGKRMTPGARHTTHGMHNNIIHKPGFSSSQTLLHNPSNSSRAAERMLRSTLARDETNSISEKRRRHSSATPNLVVGNGGLESSESATTLKPHEKILRARLERVLLANVQADGTSLYGVDDGRRVRASSTESVNMGRRRSRSRAGSDTGMLGWFWSKGSTVDDEYEDGGDEAIPLPVPPIACPHVQAFSQTSHFARFTSPQQPALPSSPSASSPQNPSRMRSHTSPVPSNFYNAFQSPSQSPRPRHAFSLETVPSVGEMSVEEMESDVDIQADTTKTDTTRANGNTSRGVTQSLNQAQKTPRMPTPPPTPPLRRLETSGIRSTGQTPSVSGSSASNTRQNRTRRSTEPMHTTQQSALATAIRSPSRSSTPATASAFLTEAKSRRKSTPVSGSVQAVKNSERRRSIPASTGAGPDPRCHPRNVNNSAGQIDFVQSGNHHLVVQKPDARTQHVRQSTMPVNLSSSLPSPSFASYLQTRHRLSNSTSNPLPPSPTVHTSHPSPSSSASMSTPSPTSPSQPPSPSTTASSFNAHTASMRCRQIDGYVSFAAVAGLEEPHGDDEYADGPEGLAGRSSSDRGWVGRLLGL
ncbi:uncharacterized protein C8R40DRAFT_1176994 [Lentinula edodes]|uniref:uncharacterized protein n=1 Tax=Lentinula edodes TaxID=5353 RepID=UPI001E8E2FCD|nr:uncharacterized protein C8R40DRAFT_1176994 [Lentinula edodes]KAH7869198.1 hypothetical protein C8R40DRAFT_1176994 [Lentinula edodes]